MKGFQLKIEGDWGHFKKPETNNNPLSHDLITKTALIGMVGAVLGIERKDMRPLFPQLSVGLLYGVQLLSPVKKISYGFTSRTAINPTSPGNPKYFEFLKKPSFKVCIALNNSEFKDIFNKFIFSIKNQESIYQPVLGWHNCPADLTYISEGEFTINPSGKFSTYGFVQPPPKHEPVISEETNFRIGFDKLPTYQSNKFWNLPDKYQRVIYPEALNSLVVKGEHYTYTVNKAKWWLI